MHWPSGSRFAVCFHCIGQVLRSQAIRCQERNADTIDGGTRGVNPILLPPTKMKSRRPEFYCEYVCSEGIWILTNSNCGPGQVCPQVAGPCGSPEEGAVIFLPPEPDEELDSTDSRNP